MKKLSELAKKFQIKLAQDPFAGLAPEQLSSMPVEQLQNQVFGPSQSAPAAKPVTAPSRNVQPVKAPSQSALPADIKAKLDTGAPGFKGALYVTMPNPADPKGLTIAYNIDRVGNRSANQVKAILDRALPGYRIEVVGHKNPTWTTNYY